MCVTSRRPDRIKTTNLQTLWLSGNKLNDMSATIAQLMTLPDLKELRTRETEKGKVPMRSNSIDAVFTDMGNMPAASKPSPRSKARRVSFTGDVESA